MGHDILKFEQTSLLWASASYLIRGELELCFWGDKLIKDFPWLRDHGTVWQNFSLLFNATDRQKYYLDYVIC